MFPNQTNINEIIPIIDQLHSRKPNTSPNPRPTFQRKTPFDGKNQSIIKSNTFYCVKGNIEVKEEEYLVVGSR
jgi:hypothetical protein